MLCRSLSWMGWAGLAAVLAPSPELGAGLGLVAEAAAGAEGAGVARVEEVVEDGVTAADWLRELGRARGHWRVTCPQRYHNTSVQHQTSLCYQISRRSLNHEMDRPSPGAYSVLQHLVCPASVKEATPGDTREPGVRLTYLDEELLAGGPPLPSKLARPGPVRAPRPPARSKDTVQNSRLARGPLPHHRADPPSTTAQDKQRKDQRGPVCGGPGPGLLRRVLAA